MRGDTLLPGKGAYTAVYSRAAVLRFRKSWQVDFHHRAGFAVGTQGRANERFLQRFLATAGVEVVYATDATTHRYATLYRQLRQQGTPMPTNDLWIAALVTEHGARLCTGDAHFGKLAQLDVV
jgi:predicted nucleic acid-binding protein